MENVKRALLVIGLFALGYFAKTTIDHVVNWNASKLQYLQSEVDRLNNSQDTLRSLMQYQSRQIDTLLNIHPWKAASKKRK